MQVELIGCTGAGKSTLLEAIIQACAAQGIPASSGEDILLQHFGLGWVRLPLARSVLLDVLALPYTLRSWKRNRAFLRFAWKVIKGLPRTVRAWDRLNIARNVLKKVGLHEALRRTVPTGRVVIVDEGTVHSAHYLFVHAAADLSQQHITVFASLVPLPDALVLVRASKEELLARTLARGHKRIPAASPRLAQAFIGRAVELFGLLSAMPMIRERVFTVDGEGHLSTPGGSFLAADRVRLATILREAMGISQRTGHQEAAASAPGENMVVSHDAGTN